MNIRYTIHTSSMTEDEVSPEALRTAAERQGSIVERVIRGEYPDAKIEVEILDRVSGVGGGVASNDLTDSELGSLRDLVAHATERANDEIWA